MTTTALLIFFLHLNVYCRVGLVLTIWSTIVIMRVVMNRLPVVTAHVAKLVSTSTSHMVAALILLNNHPTFLTSFVSEVIDQKVNLLIIAIPRVLG